MVHWDVMRACSQQQAGESSRGCEQLLISSPGEGEAHLIWHPHLCLMNSLCSPCTKRHYKSSINWALMISMRWSFTAKSSHSTVQWSPSRAVEHMVQWGNIQQRITKKSQMLHGDLDVQRSSLRLWAIEGLLESVNEICCLTSLYCNPHFYQNVGDQGQTEAHSGGTWASDEHNPREYLSGRPYQSVWFPYWYNKTPGLCVFVRLCVCGAQARICWALGGRYRREPQFF